MCVDGQHSLFLIKVMQEGITPLITILTVQHHQNPNTSRPCTVGPPNPTLCPCDGLQRASDWNTQQMKATSSSSWRQTWSYSRLRCPLQPARGHPSACPWWIVMMRRMLTRHYFNTFPNPGKGGRVRPAQRRLVMMYPLFLSHRPQSFLVYLAVSGLCYFYLLNLLMKVLLRVFTWELSLCCHFLLS